MNLYEITNGYLGCSYVRAYAWAFDEEHALALFVAKNGQGQDLRCRRLMSANSQPFCTKASDEGWGD